MVPIIIDRLQIIAEDWCVPDKEKRKSPSFFFASSPVRFFHIKVFVEIFLLYIGFCLKFHFPLIFSRSVLGCGKPFKLKLFCSFPRSSLNVPFKALKLIISNQFWTNNYPTISLPCIHDFACAFLCTPVTF